MLIKVKKNRDSLKVSSQKKAFPDFRSVKFDKDPGMLVVKELIQGIKEEGHSELPSEYSDILQDISSVSSTMSMFQTEDQGLLNKLRENLDNPQSQMMCEPESLELKQQVFKTYPLIFKRLENISRMSSSSGKLPEFVKKKIYVKVIE